MNHAAQHTIIGNSAAALAAVRAIRRCGDVRPIVMISDENTFAYSPVLTTYYIGGRIRRSDMFLTDRDFYRRYNVEPLFGHRVEALDPKNQMLHLQGHKSMHYDQLLIASGASARRLEGIDPAARHRVHTLRTVADAERIREHSACAKSVVVLGAGLVSLQTIKAILPTQVKIWLVVGSDQVLSQQMNRRSALMIQERLARSGVEMLFGRGVDEIYRKEERLKVVTTWGESLDADLVVVGKGVSPNHQMVTGTPIERDYGIIVDDRMRTNLENIYAAGDVAQAKNCITGNKEVIATWFNACAQGEIAGRNMAGVIAQQTQLIRENVTTLMGLVVVSLGESNPRPGRYREIHFDNLKAGEMRTLYMHDQKIVGALLIGRVNDAGVIRHCIANQVDVSAWGDTIAAAPVDFARILLN